MSLLFGILLGLLFLVLIIWKLHGATLLNKKIGIIALSEDPDVPMKRGTLRLSGNEISIRFLWSQKTYRQEDIMRIEGYSTDDFSQEYPDEYVVVVWRDTRRILLNNGEERYREWIDELISNVRAMPVDWQLGFVEGTEEEPVVFYKNKELIN